MSECPLTIQVGPGMCHYLNGPARPAVFLDRDGVVMADADYASSPRQVAVFSEAAGAVAQLNARGIPVVVVSNQSGVGRGYFGWAEVAAVHEEVSRQLAAFAASIDLALYAGDEPSKLETSLFRKPAPGMFELATRILPLDIGRSVMVGDKPSDIAAAQAAGVPFSVLVGSYTSLGASVATTCEIGTAFSLACGHAGMRLA